ncbi:MAG: alanine--tRNA ligase-related protein, partial [Candidatus Bathyarchaeota archaeon]|nr:alanine--tRNA ligase-related protein [Candidatus Bathyarchaeota archaeon]
MKVNESEFKLPFFAEEEFVRKKCISCGEFFWTQDPDRKDCGDAPCQEYTFIGKPPTRRRYTLSEMRESFLSFFERNGHSRIRPYPVIARWRDDLYVTIASIADFQPFVTDGVIPPPANPLVISQPCLRFTDIDKVGPTAGRHLTIFEMGGHHAFNYPDKQIYWKDETVRLHHKFMTKELGVKSDSVTYKEGMWSGGGNAGPDLEGSADGLEVSTLVFMQYKVLDGKLIDMPLKVVDTGYGMERYTWLSQGALSGFHAVYGNILEKIIRMAGLTKIDEEILAENTKLSSVINVEKAAYKKALRKTAAERLNMDPVELDRMITPIESVYTIADHTRALTFMLAEGVVPSNVKVGYLARLLIRRAFRLLRRLGIEDEFSNVVETQIQYWSSDYPHLKEMREEILEALSVEEEKYIKTIEKGIELSKRVVTDLKGKGLSTIPEETLIELYDSHGIPPEMLKDEIKPVEINVSIPPNFYTMVAERHVSAPPKEEPTFVKKLKDDVSDLPET